MKRRVTKQPNRRHRAALLAGIVFSFFAIASSARAFNPAADEVACVLIEGANPAADFNADGFVDGRDVQALVDRELYRAGAKHPLAGDYIAARKIGLDRWSQNTVTYKIDDRIWRAACAAEYQALTGDNQYEWLLLLECRHIAAQPPPKSDAYAWFVTNPESLTEMLTRTAAVNPKAREILRPLLLDLLDRLHRGTTAHGWNVNHGKVSLCRVLLQQALGLPCDPFADYGANRGGDWMMAHMVTPEGWNLSMVGSPWYMIFNEVLVRMLWDVRHLMTPEQRQTFDAVYYFAFYWQIGGASPYVGEDHDKLLIEQAGGAKWRKSYALWTGYPRQWRGTDPISTYMRWHALHDLGMATHFDDLFCPPTPAECPPRPALPRVRDFKFALIVEAPGLPPALYYFADEGNRRITQSHKGLQRSFAKTGEAVFTP